MDCSPPGSSVHGILQARILEWVAFSFSRGSSWPRDWTQVSRIRGRCFNLWATREVEMLKKKPFRLKIKISLWLVYTGRDKEHWKLYTQLSHPCISRGVVPGAPAYTKICRHSQPTIRDIPTSTIPHIHCSTATDSTKPEFNQTQTMSYCTCLFKNILGGTVKMAEE